MIIFSCSPFLAHLETANELLLRDRYKEAIEIYDSILAVDSTHLEALINAGKASLTTGAYAQARYYFSQVLKFYGDREADAYLYRGMGYQYAGAYMDYAIKDYTKFLDLEKNRDKRELAYCRRTLCYLALNNLDSALDDCDRAMKINSKNSFIYETRGDIYCRAGEKEKAAENYRKAYNIEKRADNSRHIERIVQKLKEPCTDVILRKSLQRTIDNAKEGDTIYIPPGLYYDNITIKNRNNICIICREETANIKTVNKVGYQLCMVNSAGITLSGFNFYQSKQNINTISIKIINSKKIRILNCRVMGKNRMGVYIKGSSDVVCKGCEISNTSKGITLWDTEDVRILDCMFWNNGFFNNSLDISIDNKSLDVKIDNINRTFPDGKPLPSEFLGMLDRAGKRALFTDEPYLLTGDFNGDGRIDNAVQTVSLDKPTQKGIEIAVFTSDNNVSFIHLFVNQNLSWRVIKNDTAYKIGISYIAEREGYDEGEIYFEEGVFKFMLNIK